MNSAVNSPSVIRGKLCSTAANHTNSVSGKIAEAALPCTTGDKVIHRISKETNEKKVNSLIELDIN